LAEAPLPDDERVWCSPPPFLAHVTRPPAERLPTATILAIANAWPPMPAGTGRALRGMLGDRADTVVLAPREADPRASGGAVVLPRLRFAHRARGPLKLYSLLQHAEIVAAPVVWCARRRVRERPRALVCIQPLFAGVGGLLVRRWFGIPYIVVAYGEELTTWLADPAPFRLRLRLMRAVLHGAAAVIVTSAKTRLMAEELHAVPGDRLHIIYPAIDTSEPAVAPADAAALRHQLTGGGPMLLMVGRLAERHKGFDTAIGAMPAVLAEVPTARLVIAGPGDQEHLRALARAAGVASAVTFLGHVDGDLLPRLFAACDLFLLPGREVEGSAEGFGVVFLEAALAGKPVIGGRAGGVPEAVADGESGVLVDGHSTVAVARAAVRLLCDRGYAADLGARGRARVVREFDGRRQHAQLDAVIHHVLASRGR
jgi:phosphatidylinositol alpha-1,6-mannosyltransferase